MELNYKSPKTERESVTRSNKASEGIHKLIDGVLSSEVAAGHRPALRAGRLSAGSLILHSDFYGFARFEFIREQQVRCLGVWNSSFIRLLECPLYSIDHVLCIWAHASECPTIFSVHISPLGRQSNE